MTNNTRIVSQRARRYAMGEFVVRRELIDCKDLAEILTRFEEETLALSRDGEREALQARVAPWMQECFGPEISADRVERGDRFLEEALELLQSGGYDRDRVHALVDYVWGRPAGEPSQEVGGVMVTLAAYCLAFGLDMHEAGETELARILQPEIVEKIRVKQAAKAAAIGNTSPLPIATKDLIPESKAGDSFSEDLTTAVRMGRCPGIPAALPWKSNAGVREAADIIAMIRERDGQNFDGEVHLTSAEGQEIIRALSAPAIDVVGKAREALEQWKCGSCGGSGVYKNQWFRDGEFVEENLTCKVCSGDGLHRIARTALASLTGEGDRG